MNVAIAVTIVVVAFSIIYYFLWNDRNNYGKQIFVLIFSSLFIYYYFISFCACLLSRLFVMSFSINVEMCKFFLHTGWNMWLSWKSNNNNKNRLHGSFFLFGDIVNNVTFVARYTFDGKHCILNREIVNQTFPTQQ